MEITVFWDMALHSVGKIYQYFRETYHMTRIGEGDCMYLQNNNQFLSGNMVLPPRTELSSNVRTYI
jgi:uncharacterized protein (UPF0548 family)